MTQNSFKAIPGKEELLEWYSMNGSNIIHNVNNHFHTPYSFSAFSDIKEVFEMAKKENIKVLGINDFLPDIKVLQCQPANRYAATAPRF